MAKRLNVAIAQAGWLASTVSAMACFWLTGFSYAFGATRRLRRGVVAFIDALDVSSAGHPADTNRLAASVHAPPTSYGGACGCRLPTWDRKASDRGEIGTVATDCLRRDDSVSPGAWLDWDRDTVTPRAA